MEQVDILVIGAGTAGLPCAMEAARGGARVLLVEQCEDVGGTLHVSLGQMSGAGTRLQSERGIADTAQAHIDDIARINRGTGRGDLLARTVPGQGETIDWLMEHGFEMDPACPAILHLHEAYRTARTYWGVEGGLSVLKVLRPLLSEALERLPLELRCRTEAVRLLAEGRRVGGARLRDLATGEEYEVAAHSVVLATGGYGASPELFARFTGDRPLFTAAMPGSTGSGLVMAEAAGARITGAELFLPTYAGVVSEAGGHRIVWRQMPSLTPQVRQPWELHLDRSGRRFVREDDPSVDAREHALETLPDLSFWCVFDDRILAEAPPLLPGWTEAELTAAWEAHPSFVTAPDLAGLARETGMDPGELAASVAAYNDARAANRSDRMGREHRPLPVEGPGFRAILMHGMVLKTPAGLDVSDRLEVRDSEGQPIAGLHAVGEAIGGSALSGKGFVSGMSVTPALTLGRWLGRQLGSAAGPQARTANERGR